MLHVSCPTCDFGSILSQILHFGVEGPFKENSNQQMLISTSPLMQVLHELGD